MEVPARQACLRATLPEVRSTHPWIAKYIRMIDKDADGKLSWEEFVQFCAGAADAAAEKARAARISVHGVAGPAISFKNPTESRRMTDVGGPPSLLPWEDNHVIAWHI